MCRHNASRGATCGARRRYIGGRARGPPYTSRVRCPSRLTLLLGLFLLVGVGLFAGAAGSIPESQVPAAPAMFGAVAGMILVILVIVAAFGIVQLVSGIQVLGGRSWARWAGIVVSAIAGLFALAGLAGNEGGSVVLNLVLAGANAFAIWALASSGSWFAVRSAA